MLIFVLLVGTASLEEHLFHMKVVVRKDFGYCKVALVEGFYNGPNVSSAPLQTVEGDINEQHFQHHVPYVI
jgi:hypothetical protein